MKLKIRHTTHYRYAHPLSGESHMEVRLRPLSIPRVQIRHSYDLAVTPAVDLHAYELPGELGHVDHFTLRGFSHQDLRILSESAVETLVVNPFEGLSIGTDDWSGLTDPSFHPAFAEWLAPSAAIPEAPGDWDAPPRPAGGIFEYGQALMANISRTFAYVPGATDVATPLAEFVAQRKGVCQDYAHYMIALARREGIPARYVSGYVYTGSGAQLEGGDAMHAWVELYLPGDAVWRGFDPTNNILAADRHVKVAVGVDYSEVSPTRGVLRSAKGSEIPPLASLTTHVTITMLTDGPVGPVA